MSAEWMALAVAALVLGAVVGYLYAAGRVRNSYESPLREAETGRAALEATGTELRSQLAALGSQSRDLQSRLETEKELRAAAQASLEKARESLAQQQAALEETKREMTSVFRALASEALSATTQQFLDLARTRLDTSLEQAATELETRKVAVQGLVSPIAEKLKNLQEAYIQLRTETRQLADVGRELRLETGTLATALRQPRVRGSWGELTLRRAVELAGMSSHCDFTEQLTVVGSEGNRLRPDLVIHLPGGSDVAVDAKVPLSAFHEAAEASTDAERQEAMRRHAQLVREHVRQLGSKAYWNELSSAAELVILFMPGESFFSAAIEQDRSMIEDALAHKVLLASPTTLIAALRSFALDWHQHEMERNAARISELGKQLYDRIEKFIDHVAGVREGLERAGRAYNSAVGSFNDRLLPSARRLRDLGVSADAELPALEPTETELRLPPQPEEPDGPAET